MSGQDLDAAAEPEGGRSTLLRAGRLSSPRSRPFWRRRIVLAYILGALAALVVAVGGEMFNVDGPARPLYLLHDQIWLPLRGLIWTASFPGGLIWLVPAVVLSTLVLTEYAGIAALIRPLQVRALLWLLGGRGAAVVLAWHRLLGAVRLRAALAERVLRDERERLHGDVMLDLAQGGAPGLAHTRLIAVQQRILAFGLHDQGDIAAIVETAAIARFSSGTEPAAIRNLLGSADRDGPRISRNWGDLRDIIGIPPDPATCLTLATGLAATQEPPLVLAARTIAVSLGAVSDQRPERLAWFDEWSRLRAAGDPETAAKLRAAETYCAFEFWAARAEIAVQPTPDKLFTEAFRGLSLVRPRGEIFAQSGHSGGSEAPA